MTDIVERLRGVGKDYDFHDNALVFEAANEIERLRKQAEEVAAAKHVQREHNRLLVRIHELEQQGNPLLEPARRVLRYWGVDAKRLVQAVQELDDVVQAILLKQQHLEDEDENHS